MSDEKSIDGQKISLPLLVMVPLLLTMAGGLGNFMVTDFRVKATETRVEDLSKKLDTLETTQNTQATTLAVHGEKLDEIKEGVGRLERRFGTAPVK